MYHSFHVHLKIQGWLNQYQHNSFLMFRTQMCVHRRFTSQQITVKDLKRINKSNVFYTNIMPFYLICYNISDIVLDFICKHKPEKNIASILAFRHFKQDKRTACPLSQKKEVKRMNFLWNQLISLNSTMFELITCYNIDILRDEWW